MGRPRKPLSEQKRNFSISLLPEQVKSFEESLVKLQDWILSKYDFEEHQVRNFLTRSTVFGEFVDLINSPEGYMMLQGMIASSLSSLGAKERIQNENRSFLDEQTSK